MPAIELTRAIILRPNDWRQEVILLYADHPALSSSLRYFTPINTGEDLCQSLGITNVKVRAVSARADLRSLANDLMDYPPASFSFTREPKDFNP